MKKNWNHLFEIIVFTGLATVLAGLLVTGKALVYIHPKMVKYLIFALIVLVLVDIQWIREGIYQEHGRQLRLSNLAFVIPLILIVFSPTNISGDALHNKAVKVESGRSLPEATTDPVPLTTTASDDRVTELELEALIEEIEAQEAAAIPTTTHMPIVLPDDLDAPMMVEDFMDFYMLLDRNYELVEGRQVVLDGFIYRMPDYHQDTAVVSRLMMYCCAADAYVTGVYMKGPEVEALENDEWYRITGTIGIKEIYNPVSDAFERNIVIYDIVAESIEAYDNPYIYPR